MRTAPVPLLAAGLLFLLIGRGENAQKTYTLTLEFQFDEREAGDCTTYLAEKFSVTIYSEDFTTRKVREFSCPPSTEPAVDLPAGRYYLTVSLLDANGALKSWGSTEVNLEQEKTVTVLLKEYRGGITLSWPASLCGDFEISRLTVTAEREEEPVSAIVWGAERQITDIAVPCAASEFKIQNIPSGTYTLSVAGFRTGDSERPRARSAIPPFKVTTGQDSAVPLKNYFELVVSDLTVFWDFDSKSIASCADAGVSSVRARVVSSEDEELSQTMECDLAGSRRFAFYDIPAGDYTVTVEGRNAADDAVYSGHKVLTIEKGKGGKEGYTLTIYLKEL